MPDAKLDKKFTGTIAKVKDATQGHMGRIVPPDEWVVFLAQDDAFGGPDGAIYHYLQRVVALKADAEQVAATHRLVAAVETWRAAHPERCKVPDAAGERLLP